jgi:hypothetical protein
VRRRCGGALWGFCRGLLAEGVGPGRQSCALYLEAWLRTRG